MSNYSKLLGQLSLPEDVNLEIPNEEAKMCISYSVSALITKSKQKNNVKNRRAR